MKCIRLARNLSAIAVTLCLAGLAHGQAAFRVPIIDSGVMLHDDKTLVVSIASKGTLIYFDTLADKELNRVEVDFQPTFMAAQGDQLFVATKGAATIHVLEAATGKELKEIKLPGEPLQAVACHPKKGYLYAVNLNHEVLVVDVAAGKVVKTSARGQLLAVDPVAGKYVYTGIQKPIGERLIIQQGPGKELIISLAATNIRAVMLKYQVDGQGLKLVAGNDNAAVNGKTMAVSADGTKIAMAGAGGWRSKTDPMSRSGIAVFDTGKFDSTLGQIETVGGPYGIAFHPVLNLGAALGVDSKGKVNLFNTKSFVEKDSFFVADGTHPGFFSFGAKGTKLIYCSKPGAGGASETTIEFIPLTLTDADRALLKKAYPN